MRKLFILLVILLSGCASNDMSPISKMIFPYGSESQLRSEIKSVSTMAMTGAVDSETMKDVTISRYESKGSDIGPMLMNKYRSNNPNSNMVLDISESAWRTFINPYLYGIK